MQTGINTAASGYLSHLYIWFFCNYCYPFVHAENVCILFPNLLNLWLVSTLWYEALIFVSRSR
ncbi:hypothetical protein DFJ58DRAFT_784729 [Suillus subalutaceus]|uniref:uncharacterized protein n=1 Tax=Suillus subalutaceus TaxID=48586 RepID=UPI001B880C86|nr:uncharacterized protein DFJ58DRAFT_784729 [Suillus subalutaceus]KAG1856360.1 hypothetical protein DFJ58DRAFT_784729 [Suillus subalutaceus]